RRLQIVVLAERASYGAYLDFAGLSSHRAADGFADRVAATAVLCHEGLTDESVLGLALHELTHLYQLSVTPAALPSWFLEGSAERRERWRAMCLGAAIGADLDQPYAADAAKSRALFLELFDKGLDALQSAFTAWLAAL